MPKPRAEVTGHYEVRPHPSVAGLVDVHWCPDAGRADPRPMLTMGEDRVPLLAEALADWELARAEPPAPAARPVSRLRAVGEDGAL
jgi:hypothetical protein